MSYIFYDLNVQDPNVTTSTATMLEDSKCVVQSVWRLLNTNFEIPYFRDYGLNLNRFIQQGITKESASNIYNYVKEQVSKYESRAEIIKANVDADLDNGILKFDFYLRIKDTGEIAQLSTWNVSVTGTN